MDTQAFLIVWRLSACSVPFWGPGSFGSGRLWSGCKLRRRCCFPASAARSTPSNEASYAAMQRETTTHADLKNVIHTLDLTANGHAMLPTGEQSLEAVSLRCVRFTLWQHMVTTRKLIKLSEKCCFNSVDGDLVIPTFLGKRRAFSRKLCINFVSFCKPKYLELFWGNVCLLIRGPPEIRLRKERQDWVDFQKWGSDISGDDSKSPPPTYLEGFLFGILDGCWALEISAERRPISRKFESKSSFLHNSVF